MKTEKLDDVKKCGNCFYWCHQYEDKGFCFRNGPTDPEAVLTDSLSWCGHYRPDMKYWRCENCDYWAEAQPKDSGRRHGECHLNPFGNKRNMTVNDSDFCSEIK